jgi:hypothetical protein
MNIRGLDQDPIIHSTQTDVLSDSHPWVFECVHCFKCGAMLHAENNECMQPWVEYAEVALCAACAQPFLKDLWSTWCFLNDDGTPLKGKTAK